MSRRPVSRWPIWVALAFCLYAWLLLANTFRAQDQLRYEAEQHIINDSKRRASALGDLLAEYRYGIQGLAEAPEISNFLINKSLGMSLRYGLNTNLYDIGERFARQARELTHRGQPIYERIAYLDAAGEVLVDSTPGAGAIEVPAAGLTEAGWRVDPAHRRVEVVVPVVFKGQPAGAIVGFGSMEVLLQDLVQRAGEGLYREVVLTAAGGHLRAGGSSSLSPATEARLAILPASELQPVELGEDEAFDGDWLAVRSVVADGALSLVTLLHPEAVYGQLMSRGLLYGACLVPLVVFGLALMFLRMQRVGVALEQSKQRFQTVFDNISDAIFILDIAGSAVIDVNPRMLSMYGYSRGEALRLNPALLGDGTPEFAADRWLEFASQAATGETQLFVWHARRKNGEHFWVEVSMLRALIDGSERILVLVHDVTQRKTQEEALYAALDYQRQLNRKLEEAQGQLLQSEKLASIGQLAAGVAHEINNPIGFINSNVSSLERYVRDLFRLLQRYEALLPASGLSAAEQAALAALKQEIDFDFLREDVASLLAETLDGVGRVRKIVQDMKDFSHVDSGEWQWANLQAGLESTLNVVWNELKYKAEVVREFADLPEVECLPGQINQVTMNLLVNAAHAIAERGRITLRTGRADDEVWIEVEDTGVGIAAEHLPRIFDPFFTTKPVGKGTGLGLSLAYGIVKKHHGRIEVASEVGRGTRFRVWLPIQQPEQDRTPVAS